MRPLVAVARLAELAVAFLVLSWAFVFPSSFLKHSSPTTSQLDFLYSVLHPLLMVIGFILPVGEAILAHRWMERRSRGTRKVAHLLMQGTAFGFGMIGIWAKFRGDRGVVGNFYSLHSWLGLLCIALFAGQWLVGFLTFFHRGEARRSRATVLPWHVFIGLYTYGLAVATAETGLLEKLTFLQKRGLVTTRSAETALVNGLGIGLVALSGVVVFAATASRPTSRAEKSSIGLQNGTNGYQNGKVHDDSNGGKWG